MSARYAIIGGSGLDQFEELETLTEHPVETPYGPPSAPPLEARLGATTVFFLPRHGRAHQLPPHRINYRANVAALAQLGVEAVVGVAVVGGIGPDCAPGRIVIPDQVIDYTWGREHTFFDGADGRVEHVDFTHPYDEPLRLALLAAAATAGVDAIAGGVYGATQGPRLETRAEITRLARDGCTLVGMTGMPEAALAREAGLRYANCSLVVNWAAGLDQAGAAEITMDAIRAVMAGGMLEVKKIVASLVSSR